MWRINIIPYNHNYFRTAEGARNRWSFGRRLIGLIKALKHDKYLNKWVLNLFVTKFCSEQLSSYVKLSSSGSRYKTVYTEVKFNK